MNALREELAAAAARLVVEDGLDYATAKRRAAHQILGAGARGDMLPSNGDVLAQVEAYLAVFHADDHPAVLWRMRRAALALMEEFAEFRPYLAGAVWNGTATLHSPLHLLLFSDDPKAVEIHCINRGWDYRATEGPHYARRGQVEHLEFEWPLDPPGPDTPLPGRGRGAERHATALASLAIYPEKDERGVLRGGAGGAERGTLRALRALVEAGPALSSAAPVVPDGA